MKSVHHILFAFIFCALILGCKQSPPPDFGRSGDVVSFSGYQWEIKKSEALVGPGPNYFSEAAEDIFVDPDGHLHMRISNRNNRWYSSELVSEENFGYGTYTWTIEGDFVNQQENVVVGLFTWDNNTFLEQANSEIDIELAKWGEADKENTLQYAVQPVFFGPYNEERVSNPEDSQEALIGVSTHTFTWREDIVTWASYFGNTIDPNNLVSTWEFDLDNPARIKYEGGQESEPIIIPAPGETTNARINYWISGGGEPTVDRPHEFIVRSFSYTP